MISKTHILYSLIRPIAFVLAFSLLAPLLPASAQAQTVPVPSSHGFGSRLKQENLLTRITFKTPQGEILLILPADMRAGEDVSGTIHLLPKGKEQTQIEENRHLLNAYLLTIGTQSIYTSEPVGHWTLPNATDFAITLLQKETQGTQSAQTSLVITPASIPTSPEKAPTKNALPQKGQAGRPLAFLGLADTDLLSRHILIGGKEADFLASSPRLYIVESPSNVFGKTTLQARQGDRMVAEGPFRNDRIRQSTNPWPYITLSAGVVILAGGLFVYFIHHMFDNFGKNLQNVPPFE